MLPGLSARLSKIAEQKRLKKKLEQDIESVQAELGEKSAQFASLRTQLEKEKVDAERLERTSLTALFYSVLGSRAEQLEKERQDLLLAQLRYQQAQHQLEFLRGEENGLRAHLDQLSGVEAEYELLLAQKEGLLRQSNQAVARELIHFSEQIAQLSSEENEINEAITAGNAAFSGLERVIESLENAEGWGAWDLFGGGFLSTAIKHSHIDDAQEEVNNVQAMMSRFKRELADVRKSVDLQIDIGGFTSFADYFFDGLIIDWIVQSKIEDSLERSKEAKDIIAQAVRELENLRENTKSRIGDLQEKRAILIEQT